MAVSLRQQVREPNAVIGGQIKAGRRLRGWSQGRLGAALGVTFQQMQKYENGKNRVSACALVTIANALDLDIGFFFVGTALTSAPAEQARAA